MPREREEILSELYLSNVDIIGEGLPSWVNALRSRALENFNLLSLPSARDEAYRHTDLRKAFEGEWETYFVPSATGCGIDPIVPVYGYVIDVENGFCQEDTLVTLPDGVVYGSLRKAMVEMGGIVSKYYGNVADTAKEASTALNTMFAQDGAFVYVPQGICAQEPFSLMFSYDSMEPAQMYFSRALIVAEEGAEANIVISHTSGAGADKCLLVDHVRETWAGANARLKVTEVNSYGERTVSISGNYLHQGADSRVDMISLWLDGGVTRVNAVTDLAGQRCESNLHGIYFAAGSQKVDVNMAVNHLVPSCRSYEMIKGVVSGQAVGAFTGKVYVAPDAQQTEAFQQSRNLQLSDAARIYTEPQLEIYADDVKCSHGATIGQMDEEAVYYMRQRGIAETDAKRLQLFGFVNDVISRCHGDAVCEKLAELAAGRIDQL